MKISDLKTFDICDYNKTDEEIIEYFKQVAVERWWRNEPREI